MDHSVEESEEDQEVADILATFFKWLNDQPGRKEHTNRSYVRNVAFLFEEDGKSLEAMPTQEYWEVVRASPKNKSGNGQRAAAIRLLIPFWQEIESLPRVSANGEQLFRVRRKPCVYV